MWAAAFQENHNLNLTVITEIQDSSQYFHAACHLVLFPCYISNYTKISSMTVHVFEQLYEILITDSSYLISFSYILKMLQKI